MQYQAWELERLIRARATANDNLSARESVCVMETIDDVRRQIGHADPIRAPRYRGATVEMGVDDDGAPGAAVTLALCGSWEHNPPCPLAAHHIQPVGDGKTVHLRVVFATEPEHQDVGSMSSTLARPCTATALLWRNPLS